MLECTAHSHFNQQYPANVGIVSTFPLHVLTKLAGYPGGETAEVQYLAHRIAAMRISE